MSTLEIKPVGGLVTMEFEPACSTGLDPDTRPGIGVMFVFDYMVVADKDGKYRTGSGVIGRADALRLRNMLAEFLNEYPVGGKAAS